jgi:glycerol-3-phosphate dehydrogenase
MQNQLEALAGEYGLHPYRVRHLLDRYGSLIRDVLDPGLADRALLDTVPGAPDYLRAEIRYAVTHEGALHLEDVLTRRTRISIEYPHRGVESAAAVAAVIGDVLGWSAAEAAGEVENYQARVEAERASQARWDDAAADAVRTAAPEVRRHLRPVAGDVLSPRAGSRSGPR